MSEDQKPTPQTVDPRSPGETWKECALRLFLELTAMEERAISAEIEISGRWMDIEDAQ